MNVSPVIKRIDTDFSKHLSDLQKLIRQPSVSAKNEGIEECANLVQDILRNSGIKSKVLRIKNGVPPVVYGEIISKSNPSKTLLFYNHYDVQPAEPLDLWRYPPFSGKIIGNKIFGRGSSDDKGELISRIKAVESYVKTFGDVPCNVKFLIEGEEEIGSEHIEQYLRAYRRQFSCDHVVWEFGYIDSHNRPIVGLGMKGLLYVEMSLKTSSRDAHSSFAGVIENPAWRLVKALHTLRDSSGKILIKDWYKDVRPLSKLDLRLLQEEPFDEEAFKKEFGIKQFLASKKGIKIKTALAAEPTCNIAGFSSGYSGEGAKTVLPHKAIAKIDFRLVPDMNPKKQFLLLKNHLRSKGFGDIKLKMYHGEAAARIDPSDKFVKDVTYAVDKAYGKHILNISNAGTGPMASFIKLLGSSCISVGCTYIFSRIHSPNEFMRLDLLKKTTKSICYLLDRLGSDPASGH